MENLIQNLQIINALEEILNASDRNAKAPILTPANAQSVVVTINELTVEVVNSLGKATKPEPTENVIPKMEIVENKFKKDDKSGNKQKSEPVKQTSAPEQKQKTNATPPVVQKPEEKKVETKPEEKKVEVKPEIKQETKVNEVKPEIKSAETEESAEEFADELVAQEQEQAAKTKEIEDQRKTDGEFILLNEKVYNVLHHLATSGKTVIPDNVRSDIKTILKSDKDQIKEFSLDKLNLEDVNKRYRRAVTKAFELLLEKVKEESLNTSEASDKEPPFVPDEKKEEVKPEVKPEVEPEPEPKPVAKPSPENTKITNPQDFGKFTEEEQVLLNGSDLELFRKEVYVRFLPVLKLEAEKNKEFDKFFNLMATWASKTDSKFGQFKSAESVKNFVNSTLKKIGMSL